MKHPLVLIFSLLVCTVPARAEEAEVELPAPLVYAHPDVANASVDQYELTTFTPGTTLFVAPLRLNLREKPSTSAASAGKVNMGEPVVVEALDGKRTKEDGLVNHWYRVKVAGGTLKDRSGWLFGAFLTPFVLKSDFDGDKADELATVSFDASAKILVRVLDGDDKVSEVTLEPAGQAYQSRKGGQVIAQLLPAEKMGLPLIKLISTIEACGDFFDAFISYTGGKTREALMLRGVGDPPVHQSHVPTFSKDTVVVETIDSEQDDKGKETRKSSKKTYHFAHGVFTAKK